MRFLQVRSNCKNFVTGVRRQAVQAGSVAIHHDFTEALKIKRQKEVQSMHFGGNASVSTGGHIAHFPGNETRILFGFHSFLSDGLQQMALTVDNHMKKLVKHSKDDKILKEGGRILE